MLSLKFLASFLLLLTLSEFLEAASEVAFYQKPVCNGHFHRMNLGRGECRRVPEWLTEEGWNLSIDPRGHCVKVYDNPYCQESIKPVAYSTRTFDSREEVVKRCRSTKQLGFTTIRSFRKVHC